MSFGHPPSKWFMPWLRYSARNVLMSCKDKSAATWIHRCTGFRSMYCNQSCSLGGMDSSIRPGTSTNFTGLRKRPAFLEISNLISISFSVRSSLEKVAWKTCLQDARSLHSYKLELHKPIFLEGFRNWCSYQKQGKLGKVMKMFAYSSSYSSESIFPYQIWRLLSYFINIQSDKAGRLLFIDHTKMSPTLSSSCSSIYVRFTRRKSHHRAWTEKQCRLCTQPPIHNECLDFDEVSRVAFGIVHFFTYQCTKTRTLLVLFILDEEEWSLCLISCLVMNVTFFGAMQQYKYVFKGSKRTFNFVGGMKYEYIILSELFNDDVFWLWDSLYVFIRVMMIRLQHWIHEYTWFIYLVFLSVSGSHFFDLKPVGSQFASRFIIFAILKIHFTWYLRKFYTGLL